MRGRWIWAILVAAAIAAACFADPVGAGSGGSPGRVRDAALWPFSSTSPWNYPIGTGARLDPRSGSCSRDIESNVYTDVNAGSWSVAVYTAKITDPMTKVRADDQGNTVSIRIPTSARPARPAYSAGGDAHMDIIDPTHHWVDEMWQARLGRSGVHATSHTHNSLYGSGVGAGGERAYGGSAIGGLIRHQEVLANAIPHALAISLPDSEQAKGPIWPATTEDSSDSRYRGHVHLGTLAAIPSSVDINRLGLTTALGRAIARAAQLYGVYDVDSSDGAAFYAEPQDETLVDPARADVGRIRAALQCVVNNGPGTVGGGGSALAPLAPPLS
jgi:hypothetical protein